ncbi:MAG TPA: PepSY domain-containing protein [Fimbriimonas sp.]|nr:PepSY domain-containing protein [Fimbriimonas sp.]
MRLLHRWIGITTSLFMVLIASTGLLLALKKRVDWIQPPTTRGVQLTSLAEVAGCEAIAAAVFQLQLPELSSVHHIDRFELHVDKNVYKVTSKTGYREVQVEAKTARVLSVARRNDTMFEQIHDLSFLSPFLHDWVLPLVSLSLLTLGLSGIYMFFVPVVRRWQFKRSGSPGTAGRV